MPDPQPRIDADGAIDDAERNLDRKLDRVIERIDRLPQENPDA